MHEPSSGTGITPALGSSAPSPSASSSATRFSPAPGSQSSGGELVHGVLAELPLLLGVIPFGMIYGVLATQAGLSLAAAQAASAIVFAGSSQFVTTQLVAGGASGIVIVLSVAAVNLRHALYSASVAPHLAHLSAPWKALLAYLLTDEAYAVSIGHLQAEGSRANRHYFLLGAGLMLWAAWQASTALGLFIGARLPASWSLEFTLPLTFIAMVVPQVRDRPALLAALSAGAVALAARGLPFGLGLLLAAVIGIAAGTVLERRTP
jgi:branched chain amino acid efflux pump